MASRYIADVQPQQLDTDAVLALKNFAKAAIKRLEKMGVAAQVLVRLCTYPPNFRRQCMHARCDVSCVLLSQQSCTTEERPSRQLGLLLCICL